MTVELRVKFNSPTEILDASSALIDLRRVLGIVGQLEASAVRHDLDEGAATTWHFTELELGSLAAAFSPTEADHEERAAVAGLRLVAGLREAERTAVVPGEWSVTAARSAALVAGRLGSEVENGMALRLVIDGRETAAAEVTRATATHLRKALRPSHETIGSVIGDLGSVVLRGRRQAGIWPDNGGGRVTVTFDDNGWEAVRDALGQRVQVSGRIKRNLRGQLLSVRMKALEVLPERGGETPALMQMRGVGRGMTGGIGAAEYVRTMRESS